MRNFKNLYSRILMLALCAIFAFTVSVLTPEVEAASETPITETNQNQTETYTSSDEDTLALERAKAVDEAKSEATNIVEEFKEEEKVEDKTEIVETSKPVTSEKPVTSQKPSTSKPDNSSSSSTTNQNNGGTSINGPSSTGYLINIDNPDPNYTSYSIKLSDRDRDLAERIVMGEAGSMGYNGMALVAQCLRDAYVMGGYSDIASVIRDMKYYAPTSINPSQTCKDVINYIFDQGGAAVQHRTLVFYASQHCSSYWHETQNFVCQIGSVRFFDYW